MSVYDPDFDKMIFSTPIHNVNGRGFSIGLWFWNLENWIEAKVDYDFNDG
jgi:hypothetical protein